LGGTTMGLFRILGIVVVAWGLAIGAAHAQWTPESCNEAVSMTLDQLEDARERIETLKIQLGEAQRKGDQSLIDATLGSLQNAREIGIGQQLRYIDTQPMKYCGQGAIDPALVARVDTYRPLVDETDAPPVEEERAPKLEIAGITSTFVPTVPREGGGCEGPFVDLKVIVQNRGGAFPRPVDLEERVAQVANADELYLTVDLHFDFGAGATRGYGQAFVGKKELPDGVPAGGAVEIPIRLKVISGWQQAEVTAVATAAFGLTVEGVENATAEYITRLTIPIWDIYTVTTQTLSTLQTSGKDKGKYSAGLQATIQNRGATATPGPVQGYFTVRHEPGGPELAYVSGSTSEPIGPGGTGLITEFQMVRQKIEAPIIVNSQISLLCPDESFGVIVDGYEKDNDRILKER